MYDVAVIGCGIVGASAAYELSRYNCRVLVLEAKNDVANVTTKANSAILHAGYDPAPGSLMAKTNVRGVKLAKELCEKLDVERMRSVPLCWPSMRRMSATWRCCTGRGWKTAFPVWSC